VPYDEEIPPGGELAEPSEELDVLARQVIGAAIEVHRHLGPGLPEESYEGAMAVEMTARGVPFERQKRVEIVYKGILVGTGRLDFLVGGKLVVEIKAVEALLPLHRLQTLSYMRVVGQPLGLLINFNVPILKQGVRRIIATAL
jgi:GxxExxY protein